MDQSKTDRQLIEDLASNMEKLMTHVVGDEEYKHVGLIERVQKVEEKQSKADKRMAVIGSLGAAMVWGIKVLFEKNK